MYEALAPKELMKLLINARKEIVGNQAKLFLIRDMVVKLGREIEKLSASEQQTKTTCMREDIERVIDDRPQIWTDYFEKDGK